MKILVISQYFWPENFRINDLVLEWKKKGFEVEVLTGEPNYPTGKIFSNFINNRDNYKIFEGVKVNRVKIYARGSGSKLSIFLNYLSFFFNSLLFSIFKLRKKKYDIIFTFATSPVTIGLVGIILSKFSKSKNVIWLLDLWPDILLELQIIKNKNIYKLISFIIDYIYKNNDLILVQSKSFEKIISNKIKKKRIELLYSWPEKINYDLTYKSDELEYLPKKLNIIFTGSIGEAQNFEDVINVFKKINTDDIRLIILGDGRKKKWLINEISKYKLKNIILINNKPLNEVPKFVSHADVLFISLKAGIFGSSTIPGKLSTYLNFNKPILCHGNGEIKNIINENNFGLTSSPGEVDNLFDNISKLKNLKDTNKLNNTFTNSRNYKHFDFDKSFVRLNKNLEKLLEKNSYNKIKLIKKVENIPYSKNFILCALNLAFVGYLKTKDVKVNKNVYLWPDGIFAKRFFKQKINKISGRKLVTDLNIPEHFKKIHVIGNLPINSKIYLENKFNIPVRHSEMSMSNVEQLKKEIPRIYNDELVLLTLPTPKQEIIASEISELNDKYSIICIGGALNMLGGSEPPPPKILENYFEFIWRLRFDPKRRIRRLFRSAIYYLFGEISNEYKKYDWEIY